MRVWGASGGGIFEAMMVGGVALLMASAAFAETCSFTTECFDGDGCAETAFDLEIARDGGAVTLVSDAETIAVSQGGSDAVRVFVGVTESGFHLLTHASEGAARYSVHLFEGPLMINYLGQCQ